MEKQKVGRRFKLFRPGLLNSVFIIFLFFITFKTNAQTADEKLWDITPVVSPENPVAGGNFTITLLIDHPNPAEVTVVPPEFPREILLNRIRNEARNVLENTLNNKTDPSGNYSRWTAVEYLFTAQSPGILEIGQFSIITPDKKAETEIIQFTIIADEIPTQKYSPTLHWENLPAILHPGEEKIIILVLSGWDPEENPPEKIIGGYVPKNAIMDELIHLNQKKNGNIQYNFRIIPLSASNKVNLLKLDAFSLNWKGYNLNVPSFSIKIQ